jgi:hypothetical protein
MRESVVQLQGVGETRTEKTDSVQLIEILKDPVSRGFELQTPWNTMETDDFRLICHGTLELRYSGLETHKKKDDVKEMRFGDQGSFMVIAENSRINVYTNGRKFAGSFDTFWVEGHMSVRLHSRVV